MRCGDTIKGWNQWEGDKLNSKTIIYSLVIAIVSRNTCFHIQILYILFFGWLFMSFWLAAGQNSVVGLGGFWVEYWNYC